MTAPKLFAVRPEYDELFNTCVITKPVPVQEVVDAILKKRSRYKTVAQKSSLPWFVIAVIHNMECSLNFNEHLHNGDPLKKKTVNVPAGRPPGWDRTGTWEESALDAFSYDSLTSWTDWSSAGICYKFEGYNGWGYRAHNINSPYLWSYSNLYTSGKFIRDSVWSDKAVSRQCGAAVILRRMSDHGAIDLVSAPSSKLADAATLAEVPRHLVDG